MSREQRAHVRMTVLEHMLRTRRITTLANHGEPVIKELIDTLDQAETLVFGDTQDLTGPGDFFGSGLGTGAGTAPAAGGTEPEGSGAGGKKSAK